MEPEQIVSILRETPERIATLTAGASKRELRAAPEPGEWSATEILAHLRSCADVWGDAIETILDADRPTIRAVNPTKWIERTDYRQADFSSSFQAFTQQRDRLLARLAPLRPQDWSRSATVLGGGAPLDLTVQSYGFRMARHERTHWRQVAKTMHAVRAG